MIHNEEILNRFKRLKTANRIAHAYLFAGPVGIGKKQMAMIIAQLVNCEEAIAPCGECASCKKIISGNHPDIHMIELLKDESVIKIDQVRHMLGRAALKAYEAKVKVFIINGVHVLTTDAANALLKTLEEPAPNTLMILITPVPDACLDTIRSRCHKVQFFSAQDHLPQDKNRILDALLSQSRNDDMVKELSANKEKTAEAMLVLLSWLRDVLLYKSGVDREHLVYQERFEELKKMSGRSLDHLNALNAQIIRVKSLADENLNVKMALNIVRERLWGN